ncbi:hypothetical protein BDR04DRAFT_475558 [Suillus decipiens]|nr:hypothetical protein BDR04DRAFT_475558 [Suillus decipiens]
MRPGLVMACPRLVICSMFPVIFVHTRFPSIRQVAFEFRSQKCSFRLACACGLCFDLVSDCKPEILLNTSLPSYTELTD